MNRAASRARRCFSFGILTTYYHIWQYVIPEIAARLDAEHLALDAALAEVAAAADSLDGARIYRALTGFVVRYFPHLEGSGPYRTKWRLFRSYHQWGTAFMRIAF